MGNFEVLARRFADANLHAEVVERQTQRVSSWTSGALAADVFQMTILGKGRGGYSRTWTGAGGGPPRPRPGGAHGPRAGAYVRGATLEAASRARQDEGEGGPRGSVLRLDRASDGRQEAPLPVRPGRAAAVHLPVAARGHDGQGRPYGAPGAGGDAVEGQGRPPGWAALRRRESEGSR